MVGLGVENKIFESRETGTLVMWDNISKVFGRYSGAGAPGSCAETLPKDQTLGA